ncbi:MAG: DUF309 domain-containing protein [Candidatus Latescibacteria bacterium]|nr:DUF309 domain-containing protein [Candidatus Latescibacterota bacterium]MBT5832062.1 DUF309 domain-containing protein [Candidatus Latescibacterota bacterium]
MGKGKTSARIKPGYVIAPADVVEPNMSVEDWADFQQGLTLFRAHKFWESHEAWELIWRRHLEPSRIFFQGLIQLAAAYHQVQRGIYHGAVKHFNNALLKLKQFPAEFLTVDVGRLVQAIEKSCDEVEHLGQERLLEFDEALFPIISFASRS